jgi:SAM-dependent methyltransferase
MKKHLTASGRHRYAEIYKEDLMKEAEWLRRTAPAKVDTIETFMFRNSIGRGTLLELGCGTGAVIRECQRRNLCEKYVAMDYSHDAINCLNEHSKNVKTIVGDINNIKFESDDVFDIVLLSHVLEHLEDPGALCKTILQRVEFAHMIIEVPLVDLPLRRILNIFRNREENAAAHVQFFTIKSFESILQTNGLEIVDTHLYLPKLDISTLRFVAQRNQYTFFRRIIYMTGNIIMTRLFGPLWKRLYYGHYAVLCCKSTAIKEM